MQGQQAALLAHKPQRALVPLISPRPPTQTDQAKKQKANSYVAALAKRVELEDLKKEVRPPPLLQPLLLLILPILLAYWKSFPLPGLGS